MNKILDLYSEAISNDISKIELKKRIKEGIKQLDVALDFLRSVDPEKFVDSLVKNLGISAEKAHDEGRISEEVVESARKMSVIFPGEITKSMYELNKNMLEMCKELKTKKGTS